MSELPRIAFTNGLRIQRAKRPPAHGQRALAFNRLSSTPRQIIEQPRLEWVERALLFAEEVGLCLALPFPFQRVAIECVIGDGFAVRCE